MDQPQDRQDARSRRAADAARAPTRSSNTGFFVAAKKIGLLELVPAASRIALLVNPRDPEGHQPIVHDVQAAAGGRLVFVLDVATGREIDAAFLSAVSQKAEALFVAPGTFFNTRRVQVPRRHFPRKGWQNEATRH